MEFGRHLVLSTAHITHATSELLTRWAAAPRDLQPLGVSSTWYGWFVSTFEVEGEDSAAVPEELAALQRFARERDCAWLLFDCDGEEIAALPTFPW